MSEVNAGALLVGAVWAGGIAVALIIIRVCSQRIREIDAQRVERPKPGRRARRPEADRDATPMPPPAAAWWTVLESVRAMTPQQWAQVRGELDAVAAGRQRVPDGVGAVLRVVEREAS